MVGPPYHGTSSYPENATPGTLNRVSKPVSKSMCQNCLLSLSSEIIVYAAPSAFPPLTYTFLLLVPRGPILIVVIILTISHSLIGGGTHVLHEIHIVLGGMYMVPHHRECHVVRFAG